MRKLKLQVQMTIDGFIAGPKGEMDFMVWNWDEKLIDYVTELTDPVDSIVLGRKLAEGFIPHWASVAADPAGAEYTAGIKFTETNKIVFTRSPEKYDPKTLGWKNTVIAKDSLPEEIRKLKKQPGKDIIAYGGAKFVSELIKEGLIDDYHLFINPGAIGAGMPIFNSVNSQTDLDLVKASAFECGIVVLHYRPKNNQFKVQ